MANSDRKKAEDLKFRIAFVNNRRKYLPDKARERDENLVDEYGLDAQRDRSFGRTTPQSDLRSDPYAEGGMTTEQYMKRNDGGIASKTRMF